MGGSTSAASFRAESVLRSQVVPRDCRLGTRDPAGPISHTLTYLAERCTTGHGHESQQPRLVEARGRQPTWRGVGKGTIANSSLDWCGRSLPTRLRGGGGPGQQGERLSQEEAAGFLGTGRSSLQPAHRRQGATDGAGVFYHV